MLFVQGEFKKTAELTNSVITYDDAQGNSRVCVWHNGSCFTLFDGRNTETGYSAIQFEEALLELIAMTSIRLISFKEIIGLVELKAREKENALTDVKDIS